MSELDYNEYCKRCRHYSSSVMEGILCGITGKKPPTVTSCKDFVIDPVRDQKLKAKHEKDNAVLEDTGFFASEKRGIKKGMLGGLAMMGIAVVWFVGGYAAGFIFYYPPVLFLIGLYGFGKGLLSGNIAGAKSA